MDWEDLRALLDEGHCACLDLHHDRGAARGAGTHHRPALLIEQLVRSAGSREELTRRLAAFPGIGPITAEIFLREVPTSVLPR